MGSVIACEQIEHIDCLNLVQLLCCELFVPELACWWLLEVHGVRRGCDGLMVYFYKIEIIISCPFCLTAAGGLKCLILVLPNKSQVRQPGSVVIPVAYKATGLNCWTEPQIKVPSVTCRCHQHLISWNLGSLTAFKKMEVSCRLSWRLLSLTPRLSIYIS